MFEERLFQLIGLMHKIADSLDAGGVPYELVGGMAVLVHVEEADPSQSMLTRDVGLMIRRSDLERTRELASKAGFHFRHAAGLDMLIHDAAGSARNAVMDSAGLISAEVERKPPPELLPRLEHVRQSE